MILTFRASRCVEHVSSDHHNAPFPDGHISTVQAAHLVGLEVELSCSVLPVSRVLGSLDELLNLVLSLLGP